MKKIFISMVIFTVVCGLVSCQSTKKQKDIYENQLRKNDENYDPNSPLNKEHDPYSFDHLQK
ncbi:MAG: hypothetical protein KJ737_08965 [Proteobacteria bacterium]|nr:hypothetical protein [Pseudomonadota bacterium]